MNRTAIVLRNLDPLRGGKAELTIDPPEFVPARLSVSIRRGTASNSFLGPQGWQQSEHLFLAESFEETGGKLVLVLGAAVVDNALRDFDVVEMTFPEVGLVGQVVWEGITRTMALGPIPTDGPTGGGTAGPGGGGGLGGGGGPEGGGGGGGGGIGKGGSEGGDDGGDESKGGDDGGIDVGGSQGGGGGGGQLGGGGGGTGRLPLIAGLLIPLLIAVVGGTYWLMTRDDPVVEPEPTPAPVPEPIPTPVPEPTPEPVPTPTPPPAADTLQAAHERGAAALAAGDCALAQQELRPALDGGYGPTLLLWAQQQDSVDFTPCLTETSNDIRALANYQKACEAQTPEVRPALDALIDELKRRAGQGDALAEDVLRVAAPKAVAACGG